MTTTERPTCVRCGGLAAWSHKRGQWGAFCSQGGQSCSSAERLCQQCGERFTRGVDGAGTKYCSDACKAVGYDRHSYVKPGRAAYCAWCKHLGEAGGRNYLESWPYICGSCIEPIKHLLTRLKKHHVPCDLARLLLTDPGCRICGIDLVERVPALNYQPRLNVDHDHTCCPGMNSCGLCVRGFLCLGCNQALGSMRDDAALMRRAAAYVEENNPHALAVRAVTIARTREELARLWDVLHPRGLWTVEVNAAGMARADDIGPSNRT